MEPIFVENVDIVERWFSLRVDVLEPIIVDKLIKFSWILVEKVDIVDSWFCVRVDVLEPVNVDRLMKLLSISVERDETDLWRVERFEPVKVETKPTLAFIYI